MTVAWSPSDGIVINYVLPVKLWNRSESKMTHKF